MTNVCVEIGMTPPPALVLGDWYELFLSYRYGSVRLSEARAGLARRRLPGESCRLYDIVGESGFGPGIRIESAVNRGCFCFVKPVLAYP